MVGFCGGGVPNWLASLLSEETFFQPCSLHEAARKNERNVFCLDCCSSLCPQCVTSHPSHRLLQIRRYVYHDVIRLDDLTKLLDCSFVQSYITNSAKVVFINQRQQTRPFRISGHICTICDRPLQESYRFCSVACKVQHLLRSEGSVSKYLYDCKFLPLPSPSDLDDGQLTPDSVLDSPSSSFGGASNVLPDVVVRKKRTSSVGTSGGSARQPELPQPQRPAWCGEGTASRRKGAPSRSPLY